jgi:hypothetical protein
LRTWLDLQLARPVAIATQQPQVGTLKKSLLRPRLSAIIMLSRLLVSHPDCRAVLICAVRLHRGKAQIIDETGSLEAVRERTPQPSPIPQRPLTVMTAHTLQSVHP